MRFDATRDAARQQWAAFAPRAGADYAAQRNLDRGPNEPATVSRLSPYLRTRLLLESEVALAAAQMHGDAAEKFVQEVCWRTYWKGWLERRPQVWHDYQTELLRCASQRRLPDYQRAISGETGIACFDAWATELRDTGYLHNHARMWAASIWIFTLRLPWVLGADWFLTHLLDGDAASNTLSWRWVGGLHTAGKHYLARADNIARFTQGRFDPRGQLVEDAAPLGQPQHPPAGPVPTSSVVDANARTGWLLHADDLDGDGQLHRQLRQRLARPLTRQRCCAAAMKRCCRRPCRRFAVRRARMRGSIWPLHRWSMSRRCWPGPKTPSCSNWSCPMCRWVRRRTRWPRRSDNGAPAA